VAVVHTALCPYCKKEHCALGYSRTKTFEICSECSQKASRLASHEAAERSWSAALERAGGDLDFATDLHTNSALGVLVDLVCPTYAERERFWNRVREKIEAA
jgi:hypothetical protein